MNPYRVLGIVSVAAVLSSGLWAGDQPGTVGVVPREALRPSGHVRGPQAPGAPEGSSLCPDLPLARLGSGGALFSRPNGSGALVITSAADQCATSESWRSFAESVCVPVAGTIAHRLLPILQTTVGVVPDRGNIKGIANPFTAATGHDDTGLRNDRFSDHSVHTNGCGESRDTGSMECPVGSMFSQRPHTPAESWSWTTASAFESYTVTENIWEVRWWGFQVAHDELGYMDCPDPNASFDISFYEDTGGSVGNLVCTYSVLAERASTGNTYGTWACTLYEYRALLDSACSLPSGWVSIDGGYGPSNCVFMWISSPDGDGASLSPDFEVEFFDLSICLIGGGQGACCIADPPYCFIDDEPNCPGIFMGNGSACDPNDCQLNGIPDACDIATGISADCQSNGIPDECDIADCPGEAWCDDCNGNDIPDGCDVAGCAGEAWCDDCNSNGVPDGCDIADGTSQDCNANGIPDECDIANETSEDCQPNGVPDECDIDSGNSEDCQPNDIPDECEPDCDGDGIPDDCDDPDQHDHDGDVDVDMDDFVAAAACMSGPDNSYPPDVGCPSFDVNLDTDVDLADLANFQLSFNGPNPAASMEPPTMSAPVAAPEVQVNETVLAEIEQANSYNVYLFSGEFFYEKEDLRIPGRGFDFVWKRKYRSREGITTPMGVNWDHSYNIYIEADGDNLVLHDGNARRDRYYPSCYGDWWEAPGLFREITQDPNDGTFTITFVHNTKWHLYSLDSTEPNQPAGRLFAIDDRHGTLNRTTLSYDGQGRLTTITDCLGRQVYVEYNPAGHVSRVIDFAAEYADPNLDPNDSRGRVIQYGYDGAGNLTSVTYPADIVAGYPELTRFPQGITWTYTYSDGFADARLNHNLLTITDGRRNDPNDPTYDPNNPYLVNVYETDPNDPDCDRVLLQRLGDAAGTVGGTYCYAYTHESLDPNVAVKTTITDRAGNTEELSYDIRNRLIGRIEYTNREVRPGEPDYTTAYEYNGDSLLTYVLYPNGNWLEQQYDSSAASPRSRGNRLTRLKTPGPLGSAGDPNDGTCERWSYGPIFNFVARYGDARGNETSWERTGDTQPPLPPSCDPLRDRAPGGPGDAPPRERGDGDNTGVTCPVRLHTKACARGDDCYSYDYDVYGQMTSSTELCMGLDPAREKSYSYYPASGYLATVTVDPGGLTLTTTYVYDSLGHVTAEFDPNGYVTSYVFNALGQMVRKVAPAPFSYETDYAHDANGNLARIDVQNVDENGSVGANTHFTTSYDYDLLDNRIRTTREVDESHDVVTEYEYDANENQTLTEYGQANAAIDPEPANTLTREYDERDLLSDEIRAAGDPGQSTTRYDYDGNRNLTARHAGIEDPNNIHTWLYGYDGYDRAWTQVDPLGNETTFTYTFHWTGAGHLYTTEEVWGELNDVPGGAGNVLLTRTTRKKDSWNYGYAVEQDFFKYVGGQLVPIGDGLAVTATDTNGAGQPTVQTDDNWHSHTYSYDAAGRLTVVTDPKGNTRTVTAYDLNSNPLLVTEVDKADVGSDEELTTTNVYDELNRLVQTTDNAGSIATYGYDSGNNRVLQSVRDPNGAVIQQTRYVYDGLNRLVQTIIDLDGDGANVGDTDDIIISQAWDDSSRLIAQIDDNSNATQYVYDALNHRTATTYADGTREVVTYDVHDNVITRTDGNGTIVTNQYDLLDRLTRRDITIDPNSGVSNDTTWEEYGYDGLSRVIYAADNDSIVTRQYDSLGNIIEEKLSFDGGTTWKTVATEYDGVGNATSLVYPGGRHVEFHYDALDRISEVSDDGFSTNIATYQYLGPYRVKQRDLKNGTRLTHDYLPDQYVRKVAGTRHYLISDPNNPFDHRTYTWSDGCAGCGGSRNKASRSNLLYPGGPLVHNYYYDRANRMTRTIVSTAVIADPPAHDPNNPNAYLRATLYTLDGVHNRQDVAETGTLPEVPGEYVGSYAMDPNSPEPADYQVSQYTLVADGGTKPLWQHYDRNGNLIRRQDPAGAPQYAEITYDYRNQMVQYADPVAGQMHQYKYDCFRRRIAKIVNVGPSQVETRYINGGQAQWQVLEEQDPNESTLATYTYGNYIDEVLMMQRSGTNYYYHTDDMFNVAAVTNDTGSVADRYDYGDYGQPQIMDESWIVRSATAIGNPFMFAGRRYEFETELYHHRTRYLDPIAGQFLARDTIGVWQDKTSYGNGRAYVSTNPMSRHDPLGLRTITVCTPGSIFWEGCIDCDVDDSRGTVTCGKPYLEGFPTAVACWGEVVGEGIVGPEYSGPFGETCRDITIKVRTCCAAGFKKLHLFKVCMFEMEQTHTVCTCGIGQRAPGQDGGSSPPSSPDRPSDGISPIVLPILDLR